MDQKSGVHHHRLFHQREVEQYVVPIAPKMVLIDYNIWVPTADTFEIKKIDSDFFMRNSFKEKLTADAPPFFNRYTS